jgi:putative ABC transport system ATP-binding protein
MAPGPGIIFADEPTGNLDGRTGQTIVDLLFDRQSAAGATLVMITHDPAVASRCGRVLQMSDGLIVSDSAA